MLAAELAATPLTLQEEIEADATFSAESIIVVLALHRIFDDFN
jgi:hypothetical protein